MDLTVGAHRGDQPVDTPRPAASVTTARRGVGRAWRTIVAVRAGVAVASVARWCGSGGGIIGGRVALLLAPGCLHELSTGRTIALVTGTNGKTTTTAMLTAALRVHGRVASNDTGANMLDGLVSTLARSPAPTVVAEVDELHLPEAITQTRPSLVVLLNLTRDQLDRAGEVRDTVRGLRDALAAHPASTREPLGAPWVVANCDDPNIVHVAGSHPRVVWVAAGTLTDRQACGCPACATALRYDTVGQWHCPGCGLARPTPTWTLATEADPGEPSRQAGRALHTPTAGTVPVRIDLPGSYNETNAAMAIVAASLLGTDPARAAAAIPTVADVAGRYQRFTVGQLDLQLFLAKNPAGWAALLGTPPPREGGVLIALNAAEADGRDTSWIYDVAFDRLRGRRIAVYGHRAADVATCLTYQGIEHTTVTDLHGILGAFDAGPVHVLADYTSFRELRAILRRRTREGSR